MDGLLPAFPSFDYETDKSSAGPRWRKWLGRLENLFVAMALARDEDDSRRRALLLHYAGERVYDIYNAEKTDGPRSYNEASETLTKWRFASASETQTSGSNGDF